MSEPENPQVDPCGPIQPVQVDDCEQNPDAPTCDGGAPDTGQPSEVVLPPFLIPWQTIDSALSTADREINIFNRNIFADVTDIFNGHTSENKKKWFGTDLDSIIYKTGLLSSPRRDPNAPYDASQRDRYVDYFRTTFRLLWTWYNGQYERFAPEIIPGNDYDTSVPNNTHTPTKFGYLAPRLGAPIEEYDISTKKFTTHMSLGFKTLEDLSIIYDNLTLPTDSDPVRRTADPDRGNNPFFGPMTAEGRFKFIDSVFSAEQPFYGKELNKMNIPQFTSVSMDVNVDFYEKEENTPETELTSLYRRYFHSLDENSDLLHCDYDDKVQKFTSDSISQMKIANETFKKTFNQYVEISINTQQAGKIATLLDEYQMDKHIMEAICSTSKTGKKKYSQILDEERFDSPDNPSSFSTENLLNDRFLRSFELSTTEDPLYGFSNSFAATISDLKNRSLSYYKNINHQSYPLKYEYWNKSEILRFTDTIRSQIFLNKMEKQILNEKNLRSFKEIIQGQKALSEAIGYKIAKHQITVEDNVEIFDPDPVQEFYFMDSDKVLSIDFVDTQVNPGKKYIYRVYSLNFVLGSKYSYNPQGRDPNSTTTSVLFTVETEPAVQIIEAPFAQLIACIMEQPPIAPQVSFLPFQGVDNQMQILLQTNFEEKEELPVRILLSDEEIFNKMRQSQGVASGPLEYKSDSVPLQYQIFRMSTPPESYMDFKDSDYIKNIDTQQRTLLFLDQDFEPNKDYYYCFRTIDKVGISNPSAVYKVRMVSYANGIYMDLKEYEMVPLEQIQEKMTFQTALKIEPSFIQRSLQFDESLNMESRDFALTAPEISNIDIGNAPSANSIWNKRYKIRVTSKNSGKKIDLNIRFKKSKKELLPFELQETEDRDLISCDTGEVITPPPPRDTSRDRFRDDVVEFFEYNDEALQVYGIELRVLPGESDETAVARLRTDGNLHIFDIRNIVLRGEDGTEQWAENGRPYRYELNYRPGGGYG